MKMNFSIYDNGKGLCGVIEVVCHFGVTIEADPVA